ncbi:MAG: globin-coupled sensor protein, partial [Alphaproteobacteria bacterium]|nr:globin-coupled sensor protein [Alphaproteobacteria bacterium]
ITSDDLEIISKLEAFLSERMPIVLDSFYHHVTSFDETRDIIGSRSTDTLKSAQLKHWLGICKNGIDAAYIERINRIGKAHVRIGLGPLWYCGGYSHIFDLLIVETHDYFGRASAAKSFFSKKSSISASSISPTQAMRALSKVIYLDMACAINTYNTVKEDSFHQIFGLTDAFTNTLQEKVEQGAAAANELSASITSITSETQGSRDLVDNASSSAQQANSVVAGLAEKMGDISSMVDLIENVSTQINLLSLNAAIESARAGEAGKGFAVVADEVRKLADKTSASTREIADKVAEIQVVSNESSSALTGIVQAFEEVQIRLQTIANSIQEQDLATSEISNGMTGLLSEVHDTGNKIKTAIEQSS